jgi:hypothetical protein
MTASAAIADPLHDGPSAGGLAPQRTAQVRIGASGLRAPLSPRGSAMSQRIVMNNRGTS